MRDIRKDLQDRLVEIEAERRRLQKRLDQLERREQLVRDLLTEEDTRWSVREPELGLPYTTLQTQRRAVELSDSRLARFLLEILGDGQSWPREKLANRAIAASLLDQSKKPGRAVHGCLVGLKRRGLVEIVETGVWKLAKDDAKPNTTNEES